MKKMLRIWVILAIALCVFLAGCSVFKISHFKQGGNKQRLGGIPFYTMAVACQQETVWLESVYGITLLVTEKESKKEIFNLTKEIPFLVANESADFKNLVDAFSQNDIDGAIAAFKNLPQYEVPIKDYVLQTSRLVLASNQSKEYKFIDYANPHFYNVRLPLVGSADTEINLNKDLTLSKASADIEEKTLETIIGPLKEMTIKAVEAAIGAAKAAKKGPTGILEYPAVEEMFVPIKPEKPRVMQLTIKPRIYKYTLTSSTGKKAEKLPCGNPGLPLKDINKASFTITSVSLEPEKPKEEPKKQEEANTLKFSGEVKLPTPATPAQ